MYLRNCTRGIYLLLFLTAAFAWSSCSKEYSEEQPTEVIDDTTDVGNEDPDDDDDTTVSADVRFMINAAIVNHAEIVHGQIASEQGTNQSVKDFAGALVARFGEAQRDLEAVGQTLQVSLPTQTDSLHQAVSRQLTALQGRDFDVAYMDYQLLELQRAVTLYQEEINNGREDAVKNYAGKYLPYLQEFMQTASAIRQNL